MKVLIVCSGNLGNINPFIADQVSALNRIGIDTAFFPIQGKGFFGYLKNLPALKRVIRKGNYDIVHAHYGLSGMLAVMQRIIPVIVTFHGTDVNSQKNYFISRIASQLSAYNILVIDEFISKLKLKKNFSVISCGVDLDVFKTIEQGEARDRMKLSRNSKIILFASRFDNHVKNFPLARSAVNAVAKEIPHTELLELRGYNRSEMNLLMNAADVLLVTSFTESGPLVVKEAMACNLPVISTNVGDVRRVLDGVGGSYITSYDPAEIAEKLRTTLLLGHRVNSRYKAKGFENKLVASKIKDLYESVASGQQ